MTEPVEWSLEYDVIRYGTGEGDWVILDEAAAALAVFRAHNAAIATERARARAEAFEEAAKVCDDLSYQYAAAVRCADRIRALVSR